MATVSLQPPAGLLSQQVRAARYFFLNLARAHRGPLAVAFGGAETCNPDYALNRRRFDYLGVEYVAEGSGTVVLDGVRRELGPGSVFSYGRGTQCEIRSDPTRPLVKYFVCFGGVRGPRALAAAARAAPDNGRRSIPGGRRALLPPDGRG